MEPADVVVVVGSTAGGTGSGIGPLLSNRIQATYPSKICIFFGVLPKHSESAKPSSMPWMCQRSNRMIL